MQTRWGQKVYEKKKKKKLRKNLDEFFHVSCINCRQPTILNQTKCDALCGFHFVMFCVAHRASSCFYSLSHWLFLCVANRVDFLLPMLCSKHVVNFLFTHSLTRAQPFFSVCLFGVLEFLMKSNKWSEHATRKSKWANTKKEKEKGERINEIVGAFTPIAQTRNSIAHEMFNSWHRVLQLKCMYARLFHSHTV